MTLRKLTALFAVGMMVVSLSGCGSKGKNQTVDEEVESHVENVVSTGMKVGISLPNEADSRWSRDADYFKRAFKARGYETMIAFAGDSASQQAADIKGMVSSDCDLLIVTPVDGGSLGQTISAAGENGIPVISYDELIRNTEAVTNYVTFDDYNAGVLEAQYVIDKVGMKAGEASKEHTIEYAASQMGSSDIGIVFSGAYDTLKAFVDADVLLTRSGQNTFNDSLTVITPQEITESVPDLAAAQNEAIESAVKSGFDAAKKRISGICSSNYGKDLHLDSVLCTDLLASKAAAEGVASGYSGKNEVVIAGCGVDEELLEELVDGKISMTIFEPTDELRDLTVELGISLMLGEKPDQTLLEKHNWPITCRYDTETYDNGSRIIASYLVSPAVLTADTIESKLVEPGYYSMSGKYPKKN